jgi:hypothetical protein
LQDFCDLHDHLGRIRDAADGAAATAPVGVKDAQYRHVRVACLLGEQPKIGDRIITLDVGKDCARWRSQPFRQFDPP